ncbi:hypothetical protein [Reyranella sp.]|uniref:hypothetical protein n=1 Tax=Reyranella sp. TaxID=1929291 RepID=UPI00121D4549|nr:hypothetical protein [Reyranella sp.]TAJ82898.1 MAG: hypothetical protein EPO50_24675 [Reyranella sp.]
MMIWTEMLPLTDLVQGGPKVQAQMACRGVYVIFDKSKIVYIGSARKEVFGGRLIKHCVKLLGWPVAGISFGKSRWPAYLKKRKHDLKDMSVSLLCIDDYGLAAAIEAELIRRFKARSGERPELNSNSPRVQLPAGATVTEPPNMPPLRATGS